ncbi:PKD domain-containing protein [Emticicia sp. C21]|uniref:PKD domain-containing protein n=1 Tax=Emticicia sp. C21 TaxID=2302915 RepID=UPI000E3566A3|nr:PKD domain-containing protein [Emticicia sp. C21]RFS15606.1 hypothetical protein D0T08_15800 [Emticicia sp. C21]
MKETLCIISILFTFLACQNKENKIPPVVYTVPDATFRERIDEFNTVAFIFNLNKGDMYTIDFGDGSTYSDKLPEEYTKMINYYVSHQYKRNGDFTVTLTIKNPSYTSREQKIVEARKIAIADFDYELLDNGKVKLKNLSENKAENYQWLIQEYSFKRIGFSYYFYKSTEKEPIVNIDLNGKYVIKLQAINGNISEVDKTIEIKNAKNNMTFSGYYKGEKREMNLDGSEIYYMSIFAGGAMSPYGLYQGIQKESDLKVIFSKIYSYPHDPYKPQNQYTLEQKYLLVKKSLEEDRKDIIELKEEELNPDLYNNTSDFYPKAFWVKYRVKNEELDGELKVRITICELN